MLRVNVSSQVEKCKNILELAQKYFIETQVHKKTAVVYKKDQQNIFISCLLGYCQSRTFK